MGDLGGGGLGTDLQGLVSQWAAGPPANDQSTIQDYAAKLSDEELAEMLRLDRQDHAKLSGALARLQQLKAGDQPRNYDEAQVLQQGVDAKIAKLQYSANQAALDITARQRELMRRQTPPPLNENLPRGNPMSPIARPHLPSWTPEQSSSVPHELTFGRPANENQPPVE